MQILSIHLKNIKPHRDRSLDFVSGINVLSGNNGVGKSTIFEAIGYALFGVNASDFVGNIDRFITIGAKKGEVTVTFMTDSGETFKVSRSVGAGSKWLLYKENGNVFEVEEHAGSSETEARIKELLGLDSGRSLADQYKLVIGPFQNDFLGPFVIKQPTKRQEAFDEILGIDAWRKTYKGTSTMLSTVKGRIEVIKAEIEGKQEQVAVLPERKKELKELLTGIEAEQKILAENQKRLSETDKQLTDLDKQEKEAATVKNEIQILENRIRDGKSKITDQEKRVKESENAFELMEKSRQGKEAFEKAEAQLKILRAQEKQRREIEKDINNLEKESAGLKQKIEHEKKEVEKTDKDLSEEENRLKREKKDLTVDAGIEKAAARLPELKNEEEKLRLSKGTLRGKLEGLNEGREKLSEGICPFFKEECRNIVGKTPKDVFSTRVNELNKEDLDIDKRLKELSREIKAAEDAAKQLDTVKVKSEGIEKQLKALSKRQDDNIKRKAEIDKVIKNLENAEKKTQTRKADLEKYNKLDSEITGTEKVKSENQ